MFLERTTPRSRAGRLIPASPKIYAHLPYVIELDDEVVRTRDNALMLSLEVTGIDGTRKVKKSSYIYRLKKNVLCLQNMSS